MPARREVVCSDVGSATAAASGILAAGPVIARPLRPLRERRSRRPPVMEPVSAAGSEPRSARLPPWAASAGTLRNRSNSPRPAAPSPSRATPMSATRTASKNHSMFCQVTSTSSASSRGEPSPPGYTISACGISLGGSSIDTPSPLWGCARKVSTLNFCGREPSPLSSTDSEPDRKETPFNVV